jgi:hypothetical protein
MRFKNTICGCCLAKAAQTIFLGSVCQGHGLTIELLATAEKHSAGG